jgi:hypothetical protein
MGTWATPPLVGDIRIACRRYAATSEPGYLARAARRAPARMDARQGMATFGQACHGARPATLSDLGAAVSLGGGQNWDHRLDGEPTGWANFRLGT